MDGWTKLGRPLLFFLFLLIFCRYCEGVGGWLVTSCCWIMRRMERWLSFFPFFLVLYLVKGENVCYRTWNKSTMAAASSHGQRAQSNVAAAKSALAKKKKNTYCRERRDRPCQLKIKGMTLGSAHHAEHLQQILPAIRTRVSSRAFALPCSLWGISSTVGRCCLSARRPTQLCLGYTEPVRSICISHNPT